MKIKSAKSFRFWYKTKVKFIEKKDPNYNENFVGTYHNENGKNIKGFFELYHGDKPDIKGYLPSILKIAEDGQAIYEFIQNAVDCDSTHFFIFYNEKYFLAINNGEPFNADGLKSILNIAQTTKKSPDKIGRFGIGFKLVHRLVGKNEGVEELIEQYKGPVLFSWSRQTDFQDLLKKEPLEYILPDKDNSKEFWQAPYLLKIILTNFPSDPNETIKDLQYSNRIVFPNSELNELIDFTNECFQEHSSNVKMENLKQGSLFFIRLGEGKKDLLDKNYEDLKRGVQYSMNTLKRLENVFLNEAFVEKQALELENFVIPKNSETFKRISPEYKDADIKISFGYYKDYKLDERIKTSPNFYKYFPMGDENNGFGFIIHCDSFSNEANRRKLQADEINKELLPEIAKFVTNKLDNYKRTNRDQFLRMYSSLLLSDIPNKQNNEWLRPIFYDLLLEYLQTNIPTQNKEFSENTKNVKIDKLKINLNLFDFGLDHIQWFEWESENDSALVNEAIDENKLGLDSWDIRDIVENSDIDCINEWIEKQSNEQYSIFINEIEKCSLRKATSARLCEIKLFKFSDSYFYSANDIENESDLIFNFSKTIEIKTELESLGFISSEIDISQLENIYAALLTKLPTEKKLYEEIAERCKTNELESTQKQKLFSNFIHEDTKFDNIADATLRNIELFCNREGEIKPLKELVNRSLITPKWINSFKIQDEEYFSSLNKFLISENELYQEIILPNWDSIILKVENIIEFYQKVKFYYEKNEKNTPLKKENFVYSNEVDRFLSVNEVFYNYKFSKITNFRDFKNAVYLLTDVQTPNIEILKFLNEPPFKIENSDLLDLRVNDETELSIEEIKSILSFCKSNNENFFQNCTIEKKDNKYYISEKYKDIFQVFPYKEARAFIENYLDETFKILPYELDEYKDEVGVLYREPFYNQLIESTDVNEYKTELIDIIAYDEPKRKFLQRVSEIRFVSGKEYDIESFEYKILKIATDDRILREADYIKFREKIAIETNEKDLTLEEIPPFIDKVKIKDYELSLAKILPNTYQNSDHLSNLINHFVDIGITKDQINSVFGINKEPKICDVFALFSEETSTIENLEQFAFVFLYGKFVEEIDFSKFKALNIEEKEVSLEFDKYLNDFDFIDKSEVLDEKYKSISKYFHESPIIVNYADDLMLIEEPYFQNDNFLCPYILEDMSEEQKLAFIEYLYNQWDKKNKKTLIHNIDWSKINDIETEKILGFNPKYSVYPSDFALEREQLPEYLQNWTQQDKDKIKFLNDLCVWTENTVIVELRKFFANEGEFNKSKIAQESKFSDEKTLFSTFDWLKSKLWILDKEEEYIVFQEMVRVINTNRDKGQELIINEDFNFELLEKESTEWDTQYYQSWKDRLENKFSIYLFDGELPNIVSLDEISDYVFYSFNKGDIVIDDNNNIYINRNADIKKALSSLIAEENDFTTEELLLLYQTKESEQNENEEVAELRSEVERLRQRIAELEGISKTASYSPTVVSYDEYHDKIKEKSERYLFDFLKDNKVKLKWLNYNEADNCFIESWANHDFEILDSNGNILHYVDCKGTPQQKRTFYLTDNEWKFFLDCIENDINYQIYRVFNVENQPNHILIDSLWEWIEQGKVVPYLTATETIKGGRVFLTLL